MKKKVSKINLRIGGVKILPGETKDIDFKVSESYMGQPQMLSVRVIRAKKSGPIVFLTGAVHGDELTGLGIIREIMLSKIKLISGTLICVPIVNIIGFENHSRLLPDRRDLNRSFPGNDHSTLAGRLANIIFKEIIQKSDFGIDLHSAAARRTNFPQVRADLENATLLKMAKTFGCELVIHSKGPNNSLRLTASTNGCPTILYEAGETLKFEPGTIKLGIRGVLNVLKGFGMMAGPAGMPIYQTTVTKTTWLRANKGGLLKFYVKPGDLVKKGEKVAACHKLFSHDFETLTAPMDGIVLSMTTLPAIKPGEPVCHLAKPDIALKEITKMMKKATKSLHRRIESELATSFVIEAD